MESRRARHFPGNPALDLVLIHLFENHCLEGLFRPALEYIQYDFIRFSYGCI